jgi:hypothetical protein
MSQSFRQRLIPALEILSVALILIVWQLTGPVPRMEEIFGLAFFSVVLVATGLVFSIINPKRSYNSFLFGGAILIGWVSITIRIAAEYGYRLTDIPAFWIGLLVAFVAGLVLYPVNAIAAFLHQRRKVGR